MAYEESSGRHKRDQKEPGKDERAVPQSAETIMRLIGIIWVSLAVSACSSSKHATTRPAGAYDRQEAALHDPLGYSPGIDKRDVRGGKSDEYDKHASRNDLDQL